MPASSNDGLGVKIVTIQDPNTASKKATSSSSDSGSLPSIDALSLSTQSTTSSTSASDIPLPSVSSANSTAPRGLLAILDKAGTPRAFINAEEITAFRTALASTMLFKKRANVHDVTVFGAGKQAYWHIRLALLLRGSEIHHLNIINRSFDRAASLMKSLYSSVTEFPNSPELARPKIQILTPSHNEHERLLKSIVRGSSVLFCTTPSCEPLFPAGYLTNTEGRKKGRYIAAIGSYKPHMVEIHPDILKQNVAPEHGRHHHKHAATGGAVVVDSVEACLKEAGEIIQAGLSGREVVEIGELIMLKKDAEQRRLDAASRRSSASDDSGVGLDTRGVELGEAKKVKGKSKEPEDKEDKGMMEWLQKGNVIFKMVGLGLMDVVVGTELVRIADERGVGVRIDNF
jgi:ornithine cyclodeaminase/alanine dehydrogenase-like protein (mu-crystallin family)